MCHTHARARVILIKLLELSALFVLQRKWPRFVTWKFYCRGCVMVKVILLWMREWWKFYCCGCVMVKVLLLWMRGLSYPWRENGRALSGESSVVDAWSCWSVAHPTGTAAVYDWRELPQVTFLSWRTFRVCRDKTILSGQKYAGRDKKNLCRQNTLSRQAYFCRDKRRVLSRQKWYWWQLPPTIAMDSSKPRTVQCTPSRRFKRTPGLQRA